MLPSPHRMRLSSDFELAVRRGVRSGRRTAVVHAWHGTEAGDELNAVAGFIVSKQIGHAVVRNRVKRRMRAIVSAQLCRVPAGTRLVVRALSPAGEASYADLESDISSALTAVVRKLTQARLATSGETP